MAGGPARNATQSVAGGFFILHKMGFIIILSAVEESDYLIIYSGDLSRKESARDDNILHSSFIIIHHSPTLVVFILIRYSERNDAFCP
jgi:hypothetical protein